MVFWDRFRKKKPDVATPAPTSQQPSAAAAASSPARYKDPMGASRPIPTSNNGSGSGGRGGGGDRSAQHRSNPMAVCRPGDGGYDSEGNPLPVLEIPELLVQSGASREDFQPIRRLGKGSFATVLLVRSSLLERLRKERRLQQAQNSVGAQKRLGGSVSTAGGGGASAVSGNGGLLGKIKQKVRRDPSAPIATRSSSDNVRQSSDIVVGSPGSMASGIDQDGTLSPRRSATRKGEGGFGADHNLFAMKIVAKKKLLDIRRVQDVFTERNVLTRSNHPYLLKLHHTFQSEHKLFFVMDCMPGGDMRQLINDFRRQRVRMPFEMVRIYAAEVTLAISHLHDNGILYRDLKPENILLDEFGSCALADFGLSKDFGEAVTSATGTPVGTPPIGGAALNSSPMSQQRSYMRTSSFVGSPLYVAPEVLRREKYSYEVDYWSLGILIYTLMFGAEPFRGSGPRQVFELILGSDVRFPRTMTTTPETVDIICRLLAKDPAKRLRAPEIFAHKFFSQFDWGAALEKKVVPPGFVAPVFPTEAPVSSATPHSRTTSTATFLRNDMSNPGCTTGGCSGGGGLTSANAIPSERGMSDMYTPIQSLQVIRGSEQAEFENFSWANLGQAYWGEESDSSDYGEGSDVGAYEDEEDDLGEHHNFYDQEEDPELTSVSDLSFGDSLGNSRNGNLLGSPNSRGDSQLPRARSSLSPPTHLRSANRSRVTTATIGGQHTQSSVSLTQHNSDSTSTLGLNTGHSTRSDTEFLLGAGLNSANPSSKFFMDSPMASGRDMVSGRDVTAVRRQSTMSL